MENAICLKHVSVKTTDFVTTLSFNLYNMLNDRLMILYYAFCIEKHVIYNTAYTYRVVRVH